MISHPHLNLSTKSVGRKWNWRMWNWTLISEKDTKKITCSLSLVSHLCRMSWHFLGPNKFNQSRTARKATPTPPHPFSLFILEQEQDKPKWHFIYFSTLSSSSSSSRSRAVKRNSLIIHPYQFKVYVPLSRKKTNKQTRSQVEVWPGPKLQQPDNKGRPQIRNKEIFFSGNSPQGGPSTALTLPLPLLQFFSFLTETFTTKKKLSLLSNSGWIPARGAGFSLQTITSDAVMRWAEREKATKESKSQVG